MNLANIAATVARVAKQLRHDHRTLALLFIVPSVLLVILRYVFQHQSYTFDMLAPMLLGIFPMILMFLITSIATLRERRSGTLDRLLTMPLSKLDFILGYAIAFSLIALLQALITAAVLLGLLQVPVLGGTLPTIIGAVLAALLGTALGLFSSAFAKTEFQAVQFMPAFIFPQLLVCGLFVARDQMALGLQWFADIMPLTYSVDAMQRVATEGAWSSMHIRDLLVVIGFTIAALLLGSISIHRQEKP
jgi:ABC-2 type transport system permease protein